MHNETELDWWDALGVLILVLIITLWVWNFTKLTDCDFEPDYRCEIIHGIGIIPPITFITVWFSSDN